MRFLVDNMLSVKLVDELAAKGHDAVHVRTLGLGAAPDSSLLEVAKSEQRTILSGDRDFSALLAELQLNQPSVIYVRAGVPLHPERLASMVHANLPSVESEIQEGRIVVFEPGRIRVRRLPIEE